MLVLIARSPSGASVPSATNFRFIFCLFAINSCAAWHFLPSEMSIIRSFSSEPQSDPHTIAGPKTLKLRSRPIEFSLNVTPHSVPNPTSQFQRKSHQSWAQNYLSSSKCRQEKKQKNVNRKAKWHEITAFVIFCCLRLSWRGWWTYTEHFGNENKHTHQEKTLDLGNDQPHTVWTAKGWRRKEGQRTADM